MSQITVWKCDQTGKLFEDKSKYQTHLRKLAKERTIRRQIQIREAEADAWWAQAYETEMSIEQWIQFVIRNQDRFWAEAARNGSSYGWTKVGTVQSRRKNAIPMPVPRLLEFTKFNVIWSDCVGNSHHRPHNGVTCWSSHEAKDGRPRGYPGWYGGVEWLVAWPEEYDGVYLGSDLLRGHPSRCRAYTGTGGGGGMHYNEKHGCHVQRFGYSFQIFAADWPGMSRYHEKQQMWRILSGREQELA